MSELRRWSEEGATPSELALLEASQREVAPKTSRARTLGTLGIGATVLASSPAAAMASAAAAKVVAVALLVGGTAGGALVWHASRGPAVKLSAPGFAVESRSNTRRVAAPPSRVMASPHETEEAIGPPAGSAVARAVNEERATPSVDTTRADPGKRSQTPSSGPLTLEVAALERAHEALSAGDPDGALHALDRYRGQFPRGELASEETLLRVQALLALGSNSSAAALTEAYAAAHPEGLYTRRIRELVRGAQKE